MKQFAFLTILLTGSAYASCEPVELVELRAKLTERCLQDHAPEYNCNSRLRELRVMEQDAAIIMKEISGEYKTVIKTLKLEK